MSSRQFNRQQLDVIYHCVGCRALNVINQFTRENNSLYAYTASSRLTDLVQQLDKLIDVMKDIEELKKMEGNDADR